MAVRLVTAMAAARHVHQICIHILVMTHVLLHVQLDIMEQVEWFAIVRNFFG